MGVLSAGNADGMERKGREPGAFTGSCTPISFSGSESAKVLTKVYQVGEEVVVALASALASALALASA